MAKVIARLTADDIDPLSIQPPLFESEEERASRIAIEEAAKAISDRIDDELERQRIAERKAPKPIKILLLGQSESGKSTTLKNFQLMYDPKAFREERASWRAVIQLNVVRSIHSILDTISRAQKREASAGAAVASSSSSSSHQSHTIYNSSSTPSLHASSPGGGASGSSGKSPISPTSTTVSLPPLTPELFELRKRLEPLLQVEKTLIRRLTHAGSGEVEATRRAVQMEKTVGNGGGGGYGYGYGYEGQVGLDVSPDLLVRNASANNLNGVNGSGNKPGGGGSTREVAINSTTPWKHAFTRLLNGGGERESFDSVDAGVDWDDPEDPGVVLNRCGQDMMSLWMNPVVQQLLDIQNMRLEELSGFFLDSLERVTGPRYVPTDDDVLRARLKTLGVSEHRFKITTGGTIRDWKVYDVGGHRSQRAAWAPYFDDMDAIIFLAPISCFDQVLEEDHKINRLEDSFNLWTQIVSNQLLKNTNIILFLNKIDILRGKLKSGIQLRDYVVSYGDRLNDVDNTTAYLKRKFAGILHDRSPVPRVCYAHFTTVTDTKSTKYILSNLKDMLMRQNLMKTNLIT